MTGITTVLRLAGDDTRQGWIQRFVDGCLWCDRPLQGEGSLAPIPSGEGLVGSPAMMVSYDGPGLVAGGIQRIRSAIADDGTRQVDFEDGESFRISPTGELIERSVGDDRADLLLQTRERALGAPMALALAARGIFLLHASALSGPRGVIALCGESGSGKSTLAGAAVHMPELGLRRVADDQLPVALGIASQALPHFPQLKLSPDEWYSSAAPAPLPLAMVVELDRTHGSTHASISEGDRLGAAASCLALARSTVAARLFDARLLSRHLQACALASESLQVYRLSYHSGLDRLGEPLGLLAGLARHGGDGF